MKLGEAEERLRQSVQVGVVEYSMLPALEVLLAEYDRRGAIEQRARELSQTPSAFRGFTAEIAALILGES